MNAGPAGAKELSSAAVRSPEGFSTGEPEVRYAVVGAAFGLLLIFLGRLIPWRILSWPIIGLGSLFVVVMTAYALLVLWKNMSIPLRSLSNRARGHIRKDPQLGTLTREMEGRYWVATRTRGAQTFRVVIAGDDEPTPELIAHARELIADFDTLERRVEDYLAREARAEEAGDSELASEIRALRVSAVILRSPDRPNHVVIDFAGPDEMKYWYCDYDDGDMGGLRFDT
jgi:hypothetical protein